MEIPTGPPEDGAPPLPDIGGPSYLLTDPETQVQLTGTRQADAMTAIKRGLAEYLAGRSIEVAGREVRLNKSLWEWADTEDDPQYPSAWTSQGAQPASYANQAMTPAVHATLPDGRYIGIASDLQVQLVTEIWCNDPAQRTALMAMVEDALQPVDWMYGARVVLPHYHSVSARYALMAPLYEDDAVSAMRRYRVVKVFIVAEMPVVRVLGVPKARLVRATVTAE
jgi:hypothetical protein